MLEVRPRRRIVYIAGTSKVKAFKLIQVWTMIVKAARKKLLATGTGAVGRKNLEGKAIYVKANAILADRGPGRQPAGAVRPRGTAVGAAAANPIAWPRGSQTRRAAGQPKLELPAAAACCSAYERNPALQVSTPPLHGCRNPYSASVASRFPLSAGKVFKSSQTAGCGFRSDAEDGSARGGVRNHPPILFHIRGRFGSSV